jgi:hypothetical protein
MTLFRRLIEDDWVFSLMAGSLVAIVLYILEGRLPIGMTKGEMFIASFLVYLYFNLSSKIKKNREETP